MAEQEVVKHTKKIYKIWSSEEHGFWHKAKEFVLEIVIIVFAVTLSIWLHGKNEHAHQQEDVKEFLLSLKTDLQSDLKEMQEDRKTFLLSKNAFRYIRNRKMNETLNLDSINKHSWAFINSTGLLPNNGRYEGFKSSGKLGTIENKMLQNEILDLYQENIPTLILYTNYYTEVKRKFNDYYNKNVKRLSDSTTNIQAALATDEARNFAAGLTEVSYIVEQYDKCMNNINSIIKEIDKEYTE